MWLQSWRQDYWFELILILKKYTWLHNVCGCAKTFSLERLAGAEYETETTNSKCTHSQNCDSSYSLNNGTAIGAIRALVSCPRTLKHVEPVIEPSTCSTCRAIVACVPWDPVCTFHPFFFTVQRCKVCEGSGLCFTWVRVPHLSKHSYLKYSSMHNRCDQPASCTSFLCHAKWIGFVHHIQDANICFHGVSCVTLQVIFNHYNLKPNSVCV